MSEIPKMCRFCLLEEKSDINNQIFDIFNCNFEYLYDKISHCTGFELAPEDAIPPLICKNCIGCVDKFFNFLTIAKKSEAHLHSIYSRNRDHQESFNSNKEASIIIANSDGFASCDSDLSLNETDDKAHTSFQNSPASPNPQNLRNKEAALYFPGGKKLNIIADVNKAVNNGNSDKTYPCGICSKNFDTFFEYQDHQSTHNGQFVFCCSKCDKVFSTRKNLVKHDKNHKISCNICNLEMLPKSLKGHMMKHTDRHKCLKCERRHTSKAALDKHFKARHAGIKGYVCHICGKQNSCQSSMKRHIASHNSNRPYKCQYCNFAAKSITVLKVHIKRKHSGRKCICEICAKVFKSELSLQQHKKRIHRPKKHKCNVCGKVFSEKFNLDKHVQKKHSKQRIYTCKVCQKEFFTVKNLKDHMHTHRQGCESCPKCGKEFFYKKMLAKHRLKCEPRKKNCALEIKSSMSMPNTSLKYEQ